MQPIAIEATATLLPLAPWCPDSNRLVRVIDDEAITAVVRPRVRRKLDRVCQIGLALFEQVGAELTEPERERAGLLIGNDLGGWNYVEEQLEALIATRERSAINPYVATAWFPAAVQGEISIAHGLLGYSKTFSAGLLGAALAIEHSAYRLHDGTLDIAFGGGIEAPDADVVLRSLQWEGRVTSSHPASEAGCLIALRRVNGHATPRACLSRPRRDPAQALEDIAGALAGEVPVGIFLPELPPDDPLAGDSRELLARQRLLIELETLIRSRLTAPVQLVRLPRQGDTGSASFALMIAAASGRSPLAPDFALPRTLVVGTDFEGLFVMAAVERGS